MELAQRFGELYIANTNPTLLPLRLGANDVVSPMAVQVGESLSLETGWTSDSQESYAYLDRSSLSITTRREVLRISFFVTLGELERATVGNAVDDSSTSVTNTWRAPRQPGRARLWLVLRDSRGGTDCAEYELAIVP